MPIARDWTAELDQAVRDMRAAGATWDRIARRVGCSRWAASKRGEVLGAEKVQAPACETPAAWSREEAGAEPLPPFHPIAAAVLAQVTR